MHPEWIDIHYVAQRILCCGKTKAWEILSRDGAPTPMKDGPKFTRWKTAEVLAFVNNMPRSDRPAVATRRYKDGRLVGDAA